MISGTKFFILSFTNSRRDWKSKTTIIGHSVKTLKLCKLFAKTLFGVASLVVTSDTGDVGLGDGGTRTIG